jgi:hypothetical protein
MMEETNGFATGYAVGRDSSNGGYGNGMFGNDAWWIIILLLFGYGRNGFGGGYGAGQGGCGCGCSPCATQADLAAGFNNSAVLSNLNGIDSTLCQGFNGINTALLQGFAGVDNAVCTLGYQNQAGFNALSRELADCCCTTQRSIDSVKYENAKNTCDIIRAGQDNTRAILDYLTNEKIEGLRAENVALKGQISNDRQSRYIVDALSPKCPQPAYVVQPPQEVTFPTNCCGNVAYANYNNGCGCC